jgi:hypothetical protein
MRQAHEHANPRHYRAAGSYDQAGRSRSEGFHRRHTSTPKEASRLMLVRLFQQAPTDCVCRKSHECVIAVRSAPEAPVLGVCAPYRRVSGRNGRSTHRDAPEPAGTTVRPTPRALGGRNIWWLAETTGQAEADYKAELAQREATGADPRTQELEDIRRGNE